MKLSIIIPTLNEQSVLEKTLKSLRELTSLAFEIIVSDGHSTDGTVAIAKKFADKIVEHNGKTRQNIAQGRNAGAAVAVGELLLFLDADVVIPNINSFFTEVIKPFDSNSKLVALTVKVKVSPAQETVGDKIVFGLLNYIFILRNNILHIGEATGEFQMIRKSAFNSLRGFREDLVTREDADMFYRLSDIGRTMFYPKLTIYHSGRRAHQVGWPRLLWIWTINSISVAIFSKAVSKEWKVIR